jgi:hypothetical protein
MRLGEEHRARAEVIAADFRQLECFRVTHVGVADDGQVVAEGLERREAGRRQVEAPAHGRRRPQMLLQAELGGARRAVHHLDGGETHFAGLPAGALAKGRGVGEGGARGYHRLEQRQRHGHAHAAQHRAPGDVLLRDELHRQLLVSGVGGFSRRHPAHAKRGAVRHA